MAKVWAPLPRRLVVPALVALGPLLVGCGGARQVAFPPSPPVATIGLPPIWTETTDAQAAPPAAGTAAPPGTSSPPRATQAAPRSEELLPGGPWVFLCREDGSAVLRDVSGTGQRPFEGPCQPWVAPGGDVIFAGVETIGVWSVPDLTRRLEHALPEGSWVYGGLVDHYVKWSPNGENLLLVIWSPESPTFSLHRFRPGETEIEPTGLQAERMEILGWSPNGQWAILLVKPNGGPNTVQAFDAVSGRVGHISRHISRGQEDSGSQVIGWLDDETVVLEERHRMPEGQPSVDYLRRIDLGAGTETTLAGPFHMWGAALDPASGTVLYGVADWGDGVGEAPGLYTLNVASRTQRFLGLPEPGWTIPWDFPFWFIRWHPQGGWFAVQFEEGMITLDVDGVPLQSFAGAHAIEPSPDGRWFLVHGQDPAGTFLYRSDGERVKSLDSGYTRWSPDSRSFFLWGGGPVYQANETEGWVPRLIPGFNGLGPVVSPASP